MNDLTEQLQEKVKAALVNGTPLNIVGGGTKAFLGREPVGKPLAVAGHRGVVNYEPTELVITARAGTPLREVETLLAENGQMLPFEPPHFGAGATLGGAVASGLSGPARPYRGAARDFVLGVRIINGQGEVVRFGGEVMKNVAGYDVSRLMAGSMGTLGVLLEVSLKVLPRPDAEMTLSWACSASQAVEKMNVWAGRPLPLSGACHDGDCLHIRFSGAESALRAARGQLGGDRQADPAPWTALKELSHPFFAGDQPLWRLSLPPAAPVAALRGIQFVDWGGAQRWLRTRADAGEIRQWAQGAGGHATLFRGGDRQGAFHPLAPGLFALHKQLKKAMDPNHIFNPGRMYEEL